MATIDEEWRRLKFLSEHGRSREKVHVAFIEVEAKERIENKGPRPKTSSGWRLTTLSSTASSMRSKTAGSAVPTKVWP